MWTSSWQPLSHVHTGTYESIEDRRRQAAEAVRSVKSRVLQLQTSTESLEKSAEEQRSLVADLKELLAAHAYLSTSFAHEAPRAVHFVRGAQLLSESYPDDPFLRQQGQLRVAGMQKCVTQQQDLAECSTYELAEIAQHLAAAQSRLENMDRAAKEASNDLESLQKELKAARASYNLLLMPKQWSRYKW